MPATTEFTVSERHGYRMVIAAIIAGHDPDARAVAASDNRWAP